MMSSFREDWEQGGGWVREPNGAGPAVAAAGCVYGGRLEFPGPHLLLSMGEVRKWEDSIP